MTESNIKSPILKRFMTPGGLMNENQAAGWMGLPLILCFFGVNYCPDANDNDPESLKTCRTVQLMFTSLATFIIMWIGASHFGLIGAFVHRLCLLLIFLTLIAFLVFVFIEVITKKM